MLQFIKHGTGGAVGSVFALHAGVPGSILGWAAIPSGVIALYIIWNCVTLEVDCSPLETPVPFSAQLGPCHESVSMVLCKKKKVCMESKFS